MKKVVVSKNLSFPGGPLLTPPHILHPSPLHGCPQGIIFLSLFIHPNRPYLTHNDTTSFFSKIYQHCSKNQTNSGVAPPMFSLTKESLHPFYMFSHIVRYLLLKSPYVIYIIWDIKQVVKRTIGVCIY